MKFILATTLWLITFLSFSQNINISNANFFEGEPYLSIDPSNNQHLVSAWMGFQLGEAVVIKTSFSNDGGISWSNPIYLQHTIAGNTSADPSLAYDNSGNLFVCYIDYDENNFTNGAIFIRKSVDGGISWGTEVEAISITDCPNKLCVDRPWMVIDQNDNIYITSMNANQPTIVSPYYNPYVVVSSDLGTSFSTPIFIDGPNYLAGDVIKQPMPSPTISDDGTFYAAYPSYETNQSLWAHIYIAKSIDQASNFTYSSAYNGGSGSLDIYAKKGALLISNPTNSTHLAYFIPLDINGDIDIFMIETTDGINWSSPERINQDGIGNAKMQDLVWADFNENGDLAVCWRDRRNASSSGYQTETEIYGSIRFSGNAAFDQDFAISSQQVNHAAVLENAGNDFMNVNFIGDTIYAVWGDVRTGTLNIFLNKFNVNDASSSITTIYQESNLITIYPNPTNDFFIIKDFNELTNVRLLTMKGELIQVIKNEKVTIDKLNSGQYLVAYDVNNKSFTSKIIVD